VTFVSV